MSFPSLHRWPGGLPFFRLPGHAFADVGVAEDIAFEQGEDRSRQNWSFNAQLATVITRLTQSEYDRLHTWHEDDLAAGTQRFDAQVAEQGGLEGAHTAWWEAQFIGPYRWRALKGGRYEVSAELLLLDGPYTTRTAPGLRATAAIGLAAQGVALVDTALRASASIGLEAQGVLPAPALYASAEIALEATVTLPEDAARLTEPGDARITEGGDARITETAA